MKKLLFIVVFLLSNTAALWAEGKKEETLSTPVVSQELEVEKLKLELERLKLENQRLLLQIQTLQLGSRETPAGDKKEDAAADKKTDANPAKDEPKGTAKEVLAKTEELAKQRAEDEGTVVLDFTNGEIWYKNTRYALTQFNHLCEDEHWKVKSEPVKQSVNGDTLYRYRHQNLYLEKYQDYPKGVFVYVAPQNPGDLGFVSPEGIDSNSSRGAIRNQFETAYLKFDSERKEDQWQVLRYKHSNGFFDFDDLLEFWITKNGKVGMIKWGVLDKK